MCRSTDTLSPSLVRKRRSLKRSDSNGSSSSADDATTSSTGSSNSTTTSSQTARKSVSFDDTVKIYHSERLSEDELREVFYRPADYRRFRSDSCLEVLDQQVQLSPFAALCQALFGIGTVKAKTRCQLGSASGSTTTSSKGHYGTGRRDGLGTSTGKRHDACDYPWMDNYYPQDTGTTVATDACERSCMPKRSPALEEPSSPLKSDGSREKEAIRELAFWIP